MTEGIADKSSGKKTQLKSIADCIRSKYEDINDGGDEADKVLVAGNTSKARKRKLFAGTGWETCSARAQSPLERVCIRSLSFGKNA